MKNPKTIFAVLLTLLLVSLAACGSRTESTTVSADPAETDTVVNSEETTTAEENEAETEAEVESSGENSVLADTDAQTTSEETTEEQEPVNGTTEGAVPQSGEISMSDELPEKEAVPQAVQVNGILYYATGEKSTLTSRCGNMDGTITSSVDATELPTEDNQSNFGTGYGYQQATDTFIEVQIDGEWMVFSTTLEMDNSEPIYILPVEPKEPPVEK